MEVLLLAVFLVAILYFNNRISKAEWRIEELEGVLKSKERSARQAPIAAAMTREESEEFTPPTAAPRAAPAPAPTSAPDPLYSEAVDVTSSVPLESQEETSARWLGRIGAVAVLLGVVFFLKYAFDNDWIGPKGRVAIGLLFGIVTVGIGQKLRAKYLNYSDILVACGVGILYLSIYASYGFYHLIDPAAALILMALVTAFALLVAVVDSSIALAIFAILGGFMTPVVLSTGENHLIGLSTYMIILDIGVFGAAIYKKWLRLNVLAFVGTLFLFEGWMSSYYTEAQLGLTLMFGSIFFGLFLCTSVLHHLLRKEPTTLLDLALITANAAWYFSIGYRLLDPLHHELLGFFAFLLSALYLALAYVAFNSNRADRTLNLFLPGIAVVFLTIAIPLQLSDIYISLAWFAEAAVLLLTALYLRERVLQAFAWLVLVLGSGRAAYDVSTMHQAVVPPMPFWNTGFFLMCVGTLVLYLFAYLYHRFRESDPEAPHALLLSLVLGSFATAVVFSVELHNGYDNWTALPWLFEGLLVLYVGLRLNSVFTQGVGWVLTGLGLLAVTSAVGDIHREHYGINGVSDTTDVPAFFNLGSFLAFTSVIVTYVFSGMYRIYKDTVPDWKKYASALVIVANLLTITFVTSEIGYGYDLETRALYREAAMQSQANANYYGGIAPSPYDTNMRQVVNPSVDYLKISNIGSSKETAISVFWALYAILLLIVGFAKRIRGIRLLGLGFFFVTAVRVFLIVWQLGALARIVSSIAFGVIALAGSFLYAKYKSRLKEIIYD